ncbi:MULTISPECIES: YgeY family selenium metabolism-linked hydrolase [Oscillospiraceae]|uniref:Selenium metabolism hydrolase n=1 Tax=Harryflintia acetispora TaxID=1849041 RepID=A0A9X8Y7H4_9FIRM|nr:MULTISPECIES: YgeY family selenium metabolism-linked hydrolase [Oscillospiraceae]RGB69983.1 YgeY family selenium metabolism-linked hydrolase [Harryflintia acetispora]TCL42255.1 putative selenium metabolism hydrolase [Harryflintia acetispora]
MVDFKEIMGMAEKYQPEISKFLRDIVAIQSFDGHEGDVILRIKEEMEHVGFDKVQIDPMGNILGYVGHGKHVIAMDAHIDTVTYGDIKNWKFDPFKGYEDDECIGGLGSSDQKGGMAAMVYAAKIIKDLGLEGDYTLVVVGSVQEEDCDGLCWQYIIEQDHLTPEFAVITEPCNGNIRQGQRGRMEIKVTTHGISCHGSAPERGVNAVYKMAPIIKAIERLNTEMTDDGVLGKGSVTISEISSTSPSRCAVADSCWISLDRRLNSAEPPELAMQQIKDLPEVKEAGADVELYTYEEASYTGLVYPTEKFYPAWVIDKEEPACKTAVDAYRGLFESEPVVAPWIFSTNGVAIMGRHKIPCIGFGPGHEEEAHFPNEKTWKKELVRACAMYAAIPSIYVEKYAK